MANRFARVIAAAFLATACLSGLAALDTLPVLTVLDLRTKDVSREEMLGMVDSLTTALFKTDTFTVIDRNSRDAALKETEFSLSSVSEEKSRIALGKQLAADLIVSGSVSKYEGTNQRFLLSLRITETSTGKVMSVAEDIYPSLAALIDDLEDIARDLANVKGYATSDRKPESPDDASERRGTDDEFTPSKPAGISFFQLSIFSPVQLVSPDTTIIGARINLGYGVNASVKGVDLGIVNDIKGEMGGFQAGIVNFDGLSAGFQTGVIGFAKEARIAQCNLVFNQAGIVRGVQVGVVNVAGKCAGVQVGVVNISGLMRGIQIGLANVILYGEGSPFMPFVNIRL